MRTLLAAVVGAALLAVGAGLLLGGGGPSEFGWFANSSQAELDDLMFLSFGRFLTGLVLSGLGVVALAGVVGHGLAGAGRSERAPYVAAIGVVLLVVGVPILLGPGEFLATTGGILVMSGHRFGAGVAAGGAGLALLAGAVGHRTASRRRVF